MDMRQAKSEAGKYNPFVAKPDAMKYVQELLNFPEWQKYVDLVDFPEMLAYLYLAVDFSAALEDLLVREAYSVDPPDYPTRRICRRS